MDSKRNTGVKKTLPKLKRITLGSDLDLMVFDPYLPDADAEAF
jgi:hypothetical protein